MLVPINCSVDQIWRPVMCQALYEVMCRYQKQRWYLRWTNGKSQTIVEVSDTCWDFHIYHNYGTHCLVMEKKTNAHIVRNN
jgi:hypothetical protein